MRRTVRDEVKNVKVRKLELALSASGVSVMVVLGPFMDFMSLLYLENEFSCHERKLHDFIIKYS